MRMKEQERHRYDALVAAGKVHITWQKKAWADDNWCLTWAEDHWPYIINQYRKVLGLDESEQTIKLLLVDGLSGQVTDEYFKEMWSNSRTKVHVSPAGCTDGVQPVDHGIGKELKRVAFDLYLSDWLELGENRRRWTSAPGAGGFEAWEIRVLLVNLLVDAWEMVKQKHVVGTPLSFIARSFVATGMMVGIKGYFADRCTTLLGDAYKLKKIGEPYTTLQLPAPCDASANDEASVDGASLAAYRRRVFGQKKGEDLGLESDGDNEETIDFEEYSTTLSPEVESSRATEMRALRLARQRAEKAARDRDLNVPVPPIGWCVRRGEVDAGTDRHGNPELVGQHLLVRCKGATRQTASAWRQGRICRVAGDLDRSKCADLQANFVIKWADAVDGKRAEEGRYLKSGEHGRTWALIERSS